MPYTLAENAGMQPVEIVTQLRAAHAKGEKFAGINVKFLGSDRILLQKWNHSLAAMHKKRTNAKLGGLEEGCSYLFYINAS